MSTKPTYHHADAKGLLDDRGYRGQLIRGQNPALLLEKGVRERIVDSYYWKEQCFGLNAASLCDRAVEMNFIGGTTGINGRPTPFLCLVFKLLQIVPERRVVLELLNFGDDGEEEGDGSDDGVKREVGEESLEENGDATGNETNNGNVPTIGIQDPNAQGKLGTFKYLRCLAAFYIRLAWEPVEIYKTLEPLLLDYRKIRRRTKDGFLMTYVDQFVDDLLTKDRVCATSLWKMPKREDLEDLELLEPRISPIQDEVEDMDEDEDGEVEVIGSDGGRDRGRMRSWSSRSARSYDSRSRSSRSRSRSYRSRSRSKGSYTSRRSKSEDSVQMMDDRDDVQVLGEKNR
jgi:pre-mRNA-splicing factor 38A